MSATPAAEFVKVTKVYANPLNRRQNITAVREVSFAVHSGEVFALPGPNRASKTTRVRLLLAPCRAASAEARRCGRPFRDRLTLAQIGYMHENQHFPRYWTAAGLLEYYGALSLVPAAELRRRVPELLE